MQSGALWVVYFSFLIYQPGQWNFRLRPENPCFVSCHHVSLVFSGLPNDKFQDMGTKPIRR
jgi:hypothetical protein